MFGFEKAPTSFMNSKPIVDFFNPNTLHDRVLLIEGKKLYVNSLLLAGFSEFFNGLFSANFAESTMKEIELKDVSAEGFVEFLTKLYPLNTRVTGENLAILMELSNRFLCPTVWISCVEYVMNYDNLEHFDGRKIIEWCAFSDTELKRRIERNLEENYSDAHYCTSIQRIEDDLEIAEQYQLLTLERKIESVLNKITEDYSYSSRKFKLKWEANLVRMLDFHDFYGLDDAFKHVLCCDLPTFKAAIKEKILQSRIHFLEHPKETFVYKLLGKIDEQNKSNVEVLIADLFLRENNKDAVLSIYIKLATTFDLEFIGSLLMDFLEEKLVDNRDLGNAFFLMKTAKELNAIDIQSLLMDYLNEEPMLNRSQSNAVQLIKSAKNVNLSSIQMRAGKRRITVNAEDDSVKGLGGKNKYELNFFENWLENDLIDILVEIKNKKNSAVLWNGQEIDVNIIKILVEKWLNLRIIKNPFTFSLAVRAMDLWDLPELKNSMIKYLRSTNLTDLSSENKEIISNSSPEIKDFVHKYIKHL